jgi:hypothetical protein
MTDIELLNDGPTPQERQKKKEFYAYKDRLQAYDKETRHKKENAADSGDFFLKKGSPKRGVCVHRIWPPQKRDKETE